MNRTNWEANLDRLCAELRCILAARNPAPASSPSAKAQQLSEGLFLSNASQWEVFRKICQSDWILSAEALAAESGEAMRPDSAEVFLGTAGYVFFYVGPFRYPGTTCGLLFRSSLEEQHRDNGCASPFDSGALHGHITLPPGTPSPQLFHAAHELPVPDHRRLLALCMDLCFTRPEDYVAFTDGTYSHPSPYGITGGDFRQFTHEVRIPDRVAVRSEHLEAVFVAGRLARYAELKRLASWCVAQNVEFRSFAHPGESDFTALRREAIQYISRKLY